MNLEEEAVKINIKKHPEKVYQPIGRETQQSDPTDCLAYPVGSLGACIIWPAAGQTQLASITFSTLTNCLIPRCLWIAWGTACLFVLKLHGLKIDERAFQIISANKYLQPL